ncbi:PP2C family serine/threonine-protein phosphatase [Muricoccus aerilatus]|uniref:PP2C family serine/threonine-protein phosphatase n=1 Tax=Muricoccus aerilatus TaxID=452982 RepID=UPI0006949B24|nr:PP2C family serine/threonine-protein phosphatase [Roseomonas aerilata]
MIGTSHLRTGTECQDFHAVNLVAASSGSEVVIAAAADGAGSAKRSLNGARQACYTFFECAQLAVAQLGQSLDFLHDGFALDTLEDVRARIAELAKESEEPLSAYACTMLGAIVADHAAFFLQIGDGAIVYRMRDAETAVWRLALSPQRGEFANETIFVTRGDVAQRISVARVAGPIAEFALLTDGIEHLAVKMATGEPHARFFEHVFAGLRAAPGTGTATIHEAWLEAFLASPQVCARTDDDKTLILCSRQLAT